MEGWVRIQVLQILILNGRTLFLTGDEIRNLVKVLASAPILHFSYLKCLAIIWQFLSFGDNMKQNLFFYKYWTPVMHLKWLRSCQIIPFPKQFKCLAFLSLPWETLRICKKKYFAISLTTWGLNTSKLTKVLTCNRGSFGWVDDLTSAFWLNVEP